MPLSLTASDYLVRNDDGQDDQIVSARLQFIEAVGSAVPAFLYRLRDSVFPEYRRLAKINPEYWVMGSRFEDWQAGSDRDNQFTPVLMAWAREFNVQREDWILEGALQTLSFWRQFPRRRASLDISGFRQWNVFSLAFSAEDRLFRFSDEGWDPTMVSAAGWCRNVNERFEAALLAYVGQMRKLVVERGAVKAVARFSKDHFEWLALYQCGNLSLDSILHRAQHCREQDHNLKGNPQRRNPCGNRSPTEVEVGRTIDQRFS